MRSSIRICASLTKLILTSLSLKTVRLRLEMRLKSLSLGLLPASLGQHTFGAKRVRRTNYDSLLAGMQNSTASSYQGNNFYIFGR